MGFPHANHLIRELQRGRRQINFRLATCHRTRGAGGVGHDHIDADPNQPITRWSRKPGCPEKLTVISGATEETLTDEIDAAARKTTFVIVDIEGTASHMVTLAMSRTDFAVHPDQRL